MFYFSTTAQPTNQTATGGKAAPVDVPQFDYPEIAEKNMEQIQKTLNKQVSGPSGCTEQCGGAVLLWLYSVGVLCGPAV